MLIDWLVVLVDWGIQTIRNQTNQIKRMGFREWWNRLDADVVFSVSLKFVLYGVELYCFCALLCHGAQAHPQLKLIT